MLGMMQEFDGHWTYTHVAHDDTIVVCCSTCRGKTGTQVIGSVNGLYKMTPAELVQHLDRIISEHVYPRISWRAPAEV